MWYCYISFSIPHPNILPWDRARQWLSPQEISMILVILRSSMNLGLREVVSEDPHPKHEPQPQANTWTQHKNKHRFIHFVSTELCHLDKNTADQTSDLSCRGKGQRRLAACTHFPDDESMQGLYDLGAIHAVGVSMT